jgi:hypothetical protein
MRRSLWAELALYLVLLVALWYACEALAGLPEPEARAVAPDGPCASDILEYCPERHDPRDLVICLIERWDDLSRECKIALAEPK